MQPDGGLLIGEAASLLGITVPAARKRIIRGRLSAHKLDNGEWCVHLPATSEDSHGPAGQPHGSLVVVDTLNRLVEQQQSEIAFLREELRQEREGRGILTQQQAEAERRRDILLSQFAEQLKMLSQTTHTVQQTVEAVAQEVVPPEEGLSEARPRPSFWRRLLYGPAA